MKRVNFHNSGLPEGTIQVLTEVWNALQELAEFNERLADNNMRITQHHAEHLNKVTIQAELAHAQLAEIRKTQRNAQRFFGALLTAILLSLIAVILHIPLPQTGG